MFPTEDSTLKYPTSSKRVRFADPIREVLTRPASTNDTLRHENQPVRRQLISSSVIDLTEISTTNQVNREEKPSLEVRMRRYYADLFDPSIEMDLNNFMRINDNNQMTSPVPMADTRKRVSGQNGSPQTQPQVLKRSKTTGDSVKCQHCFDTFQRITGFQADASKNGPWNWHEMVDDDGQIRCPRFWYAELERVNEMNKSGQGPSNQ